MPKAARMGDSCAGHGCFPSTPITAGSGDVSINGRPAARKGDTVLLHACPCPNMPHGVHGRAISAGSASVSINGKAAARCGDAIGCGGSIAAGSGNVFIGDTPYRSPEQPCGEGSAKENAPFVKLRPLTALLAMQWAEAGEILSFLNDPVNSVAERVDNQRLIVSGNGIVGYTDNKQTKMELAKGSDVVDNVTKYGLTKVQIKTALTTAQETYKGATRVGHALSKHAGRKPEIWGKTTGSMNTWNAQAMKHFRTITRGPGKFEQVTDKNNVFLEKRLNDGRGIRLNMDSSFKGFVD